MVLEEREVRLDRPVPGWAALLIARLSQDRPAIVTREIAAGYLAEVGLDRDPGTVIGYLSRLGWLSATHVRGAWVFYPPGQTTTGDPYVDLRAWQTIDPTARFALAGEAAALHLGYLDRVFDGPIALWLPAGIRPPAGVRPLVQVIHLALRAGIELGPSQALLRRRRLDVVNWSSNLAAFGPEALLVQLAARPGSFGPWADLAAHLTILAADCDPGRVVELLDGQTASAWQRAAHILDLGGADQTATIVIEQRPAGELVHVTLGDRDRDSVTTRFRVTDHLLAPLVAQVGKA